MKEKLAGKGDTKVWEDILGGRDLMTRIDAYALSIMQCLPPILDSRRSLKICKSFQGDERYRYGTIFETNRWKNESADHINSTIKRIGVRKVQMNEQWQVAIAVKNTRGQM